MIRQVTFGFLISMMSSCRYLLRLRCSPGKQESVEVGAFWRVESLWAQFWDGGSSPTNHCWCQKTRVITLSCGIKTSVVHCLILPQNTRVAGRQTDGKNRSTFSVCCLKHIRNILEQKRSGTAGAERAKNLVSESGECVWKNLAAAERSGSKRSRSGERSGDGSLRNRFERWAEILPIPLRSHRPTLTTYHMVSLYD